MTEDKGDFLVLLNAEGAEVKVETKGVCGDCKWWNVSESYPADEPMILASECRRRSIYCDKLEDQWCGEFQER